MDFYLPARVGVLFAICLLFVYYLFIESKSFTFDKDKHTLRILFHAHPMPSQIQS